MGNDIRDNHTNAWTKDKLLKQETSIREMSKALSESEMKILSLSAKLKNAQLLMESVISWADKPVTLPLATTTAIKEFLHSKF